MYWITLLALTHCAIAWLAAARRGYQARQQEQPQEQEPISWPLVSVLVPAWQERGTVERCIASLHGIDYPLWEAIIAAGGADGSYDAARMASASDTRIRVIEQQPRGKNAALNAALALSKAPIIVVLDADSVVATGWLRALVRPLTKGVTATTGDFRPLRRSPVSLAEEMEKIAAYCIRGSVTLQGSGSIAIRRETIEALGGFPEDVLVGVDWDLDARLTERGCTKAFCPDAIVHTERPATWIEFWRNEVRWRRAHLASLLRLRAHFMGSLPAAIIAFYVYGLAWCTVLSTVAVLAVLVWGSAEQRAVTVFLWAIFVVWIGLRRAALAVEIAAYTRTIRRLRYAWVLPILLFITFAAACTASLTLSRRTMHFKGPRTIVGKSA